jgi:hypothetical protein
MARFAFLLCFLFALAACAEEHHDLSPGSAGSAEAAVDSMPSSSPSAFWSLMWLQTQLSTSKDTICQRVLGKTPQQVKEMLKSEKMIIVTDPSAKLVEIWYFGALRDLQLSVTFVDGHDSLTAVAAATNDELLKDPSICVKIQDLQTKLAKQARTTQFNVQAVD